MGDKKVCLAIAEVWNSYLHGQQESASFEVLVEAEVVGWILAWGCQSS